MCLLIFCNFSFWFLLLLLLVFCYLKWSTRKIHCFIMIFYVRNDFFFFWLWKKRQKSFREILSIFFVWIFSIVTKCYFFCHSFFSLPVIFFCRFLSIVPFFFLGKIKIKMVHSFACHNGIDNHNNNKKTFQRFWRKFRKLFFWMTK